MGNFDPKFTQVGGSRKKKSESEAEFTLTFHNWWVTTEKGVESEV